MIWWKADVHDRVLQETFDGGFNVHLLLMIAAQAVASQSGAADPHSRAGVAQFRIVPEAGRCSPVASREEILVCGPRRTNDRYRIPEEFRDPREAGARIGGVGSASLDAGVPVAPCGIFEGQRKCDKAEAAEFGWGRGRDPITVAGKIISALADPD